MLRGYRALAAPALALVLAAPVGAETLADAIALAYRTNPTLESGRYDLRATDEGLVQARSQLRPSAELDVTGTYARTVEGRTSQRANPSGPEAFDRNSNQAEVVLTQPIYTGGRATAARQSAIAAIRSGRETLRGAEGDLLLSVITAYVDVRRYAAALGVWHASVDDLEKLTREIDARKIAGEVTLTDVAQAQAQLSIARQQVVATEQALEAARTDYAALVGRDPGDLAEEPTLPNLPLRVEDAFELAERQNPELQRAVFTEQGSRANIVAAKAQGRPTLSLRGTAELSGKAVPYHLHDQDQGYTGAVVLSVPLTAGGLVASQIRQAEDRNGSDRFKIEAVRREVDRAVSYAWNQMVTAGQQADLQDEQRRFAETQLDGMINEYRVGLRSTFDVLYAQQQLRDAEVALLGSERDRYVSAATLLRQAGLLEARAIMTGVQLHDPAKHLRDVEHRNAVPWDRLLAALDKAVAPRARQRTLQQPGISGETPVIVAASTRPAQPSLSRSLPHVPIAGTVGRSVPVDHRKLH
ncbi:TolC family outer membrane protein [Sphingomonas abietis]|uniref:TolC family outer membrane protein n=1 Tax=Sphingomonas abietis TaxID=3012344 RepID=A0ABY7NYL4_9SPHN|nr:TolC family outer membrane protein [Sphingomonas abietis]WBO24456.1 TolC family outer membrane protein [Sphingomonas abietis]